MRKLEGYHYSGHAVLMGKQHKDWQDDRYILKMFGTGVGEARRRYRGYVQEGLPRGRRPDLVGGGLLRSIGGWKGLKALGDAGKRVKGDERILGDSDFVASALEVVQEQMERRYLYKARGYGFEWLVSQSVERGEKVASEKGLHLIDPIKQ